MWTLVVVKANPVPDDSAGMLQALKAVSMHALLLEAANHTFDHPVLLRAVWRNELLLQAIAFGDCREVATGKHQAIVRAQQEGLNRSGFRGGSTPERIES